MTREHALHENKYLSRRSFLKIAVAGTVGLTVGCSSNSRASVSAPPAGTPTPAHERWASSTYLNITIHSAVEPDRVLTHSGNDLSLPGRRMAAG